MEQVAIGRKNWLFLASVAAGERMADLLTVVSSAVRNHLDVWAYVKDVLDQLLAGRTDYAALRADRWAASHPEHIRVYRTQERRDRADRQHHRRALRRAARAAPLRCDLRRANTTRVAPLRFGSRRAARMRRAPHPKHRSVREPALRWHSQHRSLRRRIRCPDVRAQALRQGGTAPRGCMAGRGTFTWASSFGGRVGGRLLTRRRGGRDRQKNQGRSWPYILGAK